MVLALVVAMLNVSLSFAAVYSASRKARHRQEAAAAELSKKKAGVYSGGRITSQATGERGLSVGGPSFCESLNGDRGSSVSVIFM